MTGKRGSGRGWGVGGIVGVDGDTAKRRGSEGAVCGRGCLAGLCVAARCSFFIFFWLKPCKEVNLVSLYP